MTQTPTRLTFARYTRFATLCLLATSCRVRNESNTSTNSKSNSNTSTSVSKSANANTETFTDTNRETIRHGIRLYVSAVNCEMNVQDATRINALAHTGLTVEIVFLGIPNNDTTVVRQARDDLTLKVPVRLVRPGEVDSLTSSWKSTGGASLPVALVVRGRQLKTIVAGESMPRTLSILEAAWSTGNPPAARLAAAAGTTP
jgi:hypothetical protein